MGPSESGTEGLVPDAYREAAEAVRAHLVAHRGGAIFLSSADALRLIGWLDRGVPVCDILRAIERAADARVRQRSRVPLGLGQVSRHLGKPTHGAFGGGRSDEARAEPDGLGPLIRLIRRRAAEDPLRDTLTALAAELEALGNGAAAAEGAMRRIAAFHEQVFAALPADARAALLRAATADLGDVAHLLDERERTALAEEGARFAAREGYGWLSAATVWDLLAPAAD